MYILYKQLDIWNYWILYCHIFGGIHLHELDNFSRILKSSERDKEWIFIKEIDQMWWHFKGGWKKSFWLLTFIFLFFFYFSDFFYNYSWNDEHCVYIYIWEKFDIQTKEIVSFTHITFFYMRIANWKVL